MEGFKAQKKNPAEIISNSHTRVDLIEAIKTIFPKEELKNFRREHNENDEQKDEVLQRQAAVTLREFTDNILAIGNDRPEVYLQAYNNVDVWLSDIQEAYREESSSNDNLSEEFKNIYREKTLTALQSVLQEVPEEDLEYEVTKYAEYDQHHHLLSEKDDKYEWSKEVLESLKDLK